MLILPVIIWIFWGSIIVWGAIYYRSTALSVIAVFYLIAVCYEMLLKMSTTKYYIKEKTVCGKVTYKGYRCHKWFGYKIEIYKLTDWHEDIETVKEKIEKHKCESKVTYKDIEL